MYQARLDIKQGDNMYSIYRHINNISLNGREYVLDENNKPMFFRTRREALQYLYKHGIGDDEIGISIWIEKEKTDEKR